MNDITQALAKAGITAETAQETALPAAEVTLTDTAPDAPAYAAPHSSTGAQRGRRAGQKTSIKNTVGLFLAKLRPLRNSLKIGLHETRQLSLPEVQAKMREIMEKFPEKLTDAAFLATIPFERTGGDFTLVELMEKFGPDKEVTIKTSDITGHFENMRTQALALLSTLDSEDIGLITAEVMEKAKAEKETPPAE